MHIPIKRKTLSVLDIKVTGGKKKKKIYFEQTGKKNMISQCMILLMELSDSTCTHLLHIIILSVRFVRALCSAADREWTREVQHAFAFPSENSMT